MQRMMPRIYLSSTLVGYTTHRRAIKRLEYFQIAAMNHCSCPRATKQQPEARCDVIALTALPLHRHETRDGACIHDPGTLLEAGCFQFLELFICLFTITTCTLNLCRPELHEFSRSIDLSQSAKS